MNLNVNKLNKIQGVPMGIVRFHIIPT